MIIALLFLVQIALFVGGILGPWRDAPERKNNGRLPLVARMLLSFSLLVAALLIWLFQPDRPASLGIGQPYVQWVLFGMFASFIGDLIMARLIPTPNRLIGGMIAFGIAHALYITAYVQTLRANAAELPNTGLWIGLGLYGVISIFGWWLLIRNPARGTAINLGALVYGVWIGAMASFALALAVGLGGGWWIAALGGLLFVASDFIIGITDIRGIALKNANDWVWLTYVAGQMGIVYAGALLQ